MTDTSRLSPRSSICPENPRFLQQVVEPAANVVEAGAQLRRGRGRLQVLDARAARLEHIERQIDAVEIAVVGGAVLHMIDDLQRRAERVVGWPGRAILAVHVEHEPADRHRRVAAVVHQVVEVAVAQLGDVHAKRIEQVLRVLRAQPARSEFVAQRDALRLGIALAEQRRLQAVEQLELFGGRSVGWSATSSATRTKS